MLLRTDRRRNQSVATAEVCNTCISMQHQSVKWLQCWYLSLYFGSCAHHFSNYHGSSNTQPESYLQIHPWLWLRYQHCRHPISKCCTEPHWWTWLAFPAATDGLIHSGLCYPYFAMDFDRFLPPRLFTRKSLPLIFVLPIRSLLMLISIIYTYIPYVTTFFDRIKLLAIFSYYKCLYFCFSKDFFWDINIKIVIIN